MSKAYTLVQYTNGTDTLAGAGVADILFGTANTDVYSGGDGNDVLRGSGSEDFLVGGSGTDELLGEDGDDFLLHSSDAGGIATYVSTNFIGPTSPIAATTDRQFLLDEWFDVFNLAPVAGGAAPDLTMNGGGAADIDTGILDFSYRTAPLTFSLPTQLAGSVIQTSSFTGIERVWVRGGTANDSIDGGALDDRLYGGGGDDQLSGGAGDDFVFGGTGRDVLLGGDGDDFLVSTTHFQQFDRPNGFAQAPAAEQTVVDYFSGLQTIFELTDREVDIAIDGGAGNDTAVIDFEFFGKTDFTVGTSLEVQGPGGVRTTIRNVEAIWAIDSGADDTINGGALSDRFLSIGGADTFDGRGGSDWLELSSLNSLATNVNLLNNAFNTGLAAGDTLFSIENVVGNAGVNVLTGNGEANILYGRAGNDTLFGGEGDDVLNGGVGADTLNGGLGQDTVSYDTAVTTLLAPVTGVTVDLLNAASANTGEAAGDSYIEIENIIGSRRADDLRGSNGDNLIDGGLGNDIVSGRDGNDTFTASAGSDHFDGGAGSDTLVLSGNRANYSITATATGFVLVDTRGANFDGTDTVDGVEFFRFANGDTRSAVQLINTAPTTPNFSPLAVNEKAPAGTVVGTLSATDADGTTPTYTIVGGASASQFKIVGNQLQVAEGANLDFESNPTLTLKIAATDGTATSNPLDVTITLTDLDEAIRGTNGDDLNLKGSDTTNDVFQALGGDDRMFGSLGADTFFGGSGSDTVFYTKAVTLDLSNPEDNSGQAEGDSFDSVESFQFSSGADTAFGSGRAERFFGGKGTDTLEGRGGNDSLFGEDGNDAIDAGAGRDTLVGGKGSDSLTGGSGSDFFTFNLIADRGDRIEDFSSSEKDKIRISRDGFDLDSSFKLKLGSTLLVDDGPGDNDPVFLYSSNSGVLSFDRNGDDRGGRTVIATFNDLDTLKASDFQLFA